MNRVWIDSPNGAGIPPKWVYDYGVILNGMKNLWFETGDKKYYDFIKKGIDRFVQPDGTINTYKVEDYNIDQVKMGDAVLLLYRVTGEAKYKKAADLIRSQLQNHPRTNEGGFWHKKMAPVCQFGLVMLHCTSKGWQSVVAEARWPSGCVWGKFRR